MTEKTDTRDIGPLLRGIARPILAWTLHFIVVYAALSAACAERAVTGYPAAVSVIALATVIALMVAGWSFFRSHGTEFHIAARSTTVISMVAILFSASPILLLGGCN